MLKKALSFFLILCCVLSVCLPGGAEAGEYVSSGLWTPPDLSGLTADSPSQLRILAVAQGEVGYEAGPNYQNKYSQWFDGSDSPWCTEFFSWCAYMADEQWGTSLLGDLYPFKGTVTECRWGFVNRNQYVGANGRNFEGERQWLIGAEDYLQAHEYVPQPGDVMWVYLYGGDDNPDHTTIVEGVSAEPDGSLTVHVIEGNIDRHVQRGTYALTDARIVGFGTAETRAYTRLALDSRYGGVNELRQDLLDLGYPAARGYVQRLDRQTRDALRLFQRDYGLEVTGVQDIPTRAAMDAALAELR